MRLGLWSACAALVLACGCKERTPNRDYIPAIKKQVFLLQEAIKARTRAGLDSLLAPEFAESRGADSVVQFAYGEKPGFQFDRFGSTEIFYTESRARVDGQIVGGDGSILRDITMVFAHTGDRWLLLRIGPAQPSGVDSQDAAIDSMIRDSLRHDSAAAGS